MSSNHQKEMTMNTRARDLPESMVPHHQHDCDACIYLGSSTKQSSWLPPDSNQAWDFYYCPATIGDGSIIARHGEYGDYYSSDLAMFKTRPRDPDYPLEWAYCHYIVASW